MGSRWLDSVGLAEPEEFWRIIDSHMRMCARWCGAMFTRRTTASAATCACSRHPPPARNFCRRAIAMRWTRVRRHIELSNCTPMAVSRLSGPLGRIVAIAANRGWLGYIFDATFPVQPRRLLALALTCIALCGHGARRRRAACAVGIARQAQHRLHSGLHSRAASQRLSAVRRRCSTRTAAPNRFSWK